MATAADKLGWSIWEREVHELLVDIHDHVTNPRPQVYANDTVAFGMSEDDMQKAMLPQVERLNAALEGLRKSAKKTVEEAKKNG